MSCEIGSIGGPCKCCGGFIRCDYCSKETDLLSESRNQLVSNMAASKDKIIKPAIDAVIGKDWVIRDLTGRGEFLILPDKTEVFKFDGMELIHFMIPRTEVDNAKQGMHVNSIQEYRFLNKATTSK